MTTVNFEAHGLLFDIASSDIEVTAAFDDLLVDMRRVAPPAGSTTDHHIEIEPLPHSPHGEPRFHVQFDGTTVYGSLIEGSVVSHVLMEVNRRVASAVRSAGSISLHASSVAGPQGAIVLAGASHSGKTTLATALAVTGSGDVRFLADEVSALEPTELTIASYGKPVALRTPGIDLLAPHVGRLQRGGGRFETDERFVPPSELGAGPAAPTQVFVIVFPRFDSTVAGSDPDIAAIGPADTLTRLMNLTLGSTPVDLATFRSLERLTRAVGAVEIVYADALRASELLLEAVEG